MEASRVESRARDGGVIGGIPGGVPGPTPVPTPDEDAHDSRRWSGASARQSPRSATDLPGDRPQGSRPGVVILEATINRRAAWST